LCYSKEGFVIKNKVVIGISGMPGAGKGVFRRKIQELGYPVVIMGDEVREEVKQQNLKPTPQNVGKIMLYIREKDGSAAIAKRCIPKIEKADENIIFVDGVRSLNEVDEFKKHFPNFVILAIHASPKTRYQRLFRRGRSDDPKNWKTFMERDMRELGIGVGSVISIADYMIVNGGTIAQLKQRTIQFVKRVLKYE
jgi:dephospho-CoA kinase